MNTQRPTPIAATAGRPIHSSTRTAISTNTDATGATRRFMTTSALEMAWVNGELQMRCKSSRVELKGLKGMR